MAFHETVSECIWRPDIGHRSHGNKPGGKEDYNKLAGTMKPEREWERSTWNSFGRNIKQSEIYTYCMYNTCSILVEVHVGGLKLGLACVKASDIGVMINLIGFIFEKENAVSSIYSITYIRSIISIPFPPLATSTQLAEAESHPPRPRICLRFQPAKTVK